MQGRLRYELLVDTTDKLLEQRAAGDLSLYDIAKAADVPAASLYHFLPSMAAAVIAVARRYLKEFEDIVAAPLEHDALTHWRDIFRIKGGRAREFYDAHPVARKLFLGSEYSWQVRTADAESNQNYAGVLAHIYDRHFEVPETEFLRCKIEIAIGLSDSVWSLSCLRHGVIKDEFALEAERAYHGYLNSYIAELTRKRPLPR